jgi:hypothetical protein
MMMLRFELQDYRKASFGLSAEGSPSVAAGGLGLRAELRTCASLAPARAASDERFT